MQDSKSKLSTQVDTEFSLHNPLCQPEENEKQSNFRILSNRERDVLALTARGLTNQDIADKLGISSRTVKCVLHHACIKMRAHNRTQALFIAISRGYISIREVLSLDELEGLFASLGPEEMDSITQRLKLKDKRRRFLSGDECTPNPENKRPTAKTTNGDLSICNGNQRSRKGKYENLDQGSQARA